MLCHVSSPSFLPVPVSVFKLPRHIHRPLSLLVTFMGSIPAEVYITLGLSCLVRSAASDLPNREVALVKFISNHENPPELVLFYSRVLVRELHLNRSSSSALSHNDGNARADRQVANKVYPVCQSSHAHAHTVHRGSPAKHARVRHRLLRRVSEAHDLEPTCRPCHSQLTNQPS